MQKTILITYDLNSYGQDYKALFDTIRSLGQSKHILQSVWAVKTNLSCHTIREKLQAVTDHNDFLFICEFDAWSAFMPDEYNQFLLNR